MARRVDLVYGRSGAGKTTFALNLAHYIYRTTGKHTRWYLGDGGGETIYNSGFVGEFIEVYHYNHRRYPLETTQLICEGYWPQDPANPATPLLPPTREDLDRVGLWVFEGLTVMSDYMMGDQEGGLAWRMGRGESLNKDESYALVDGTSKMKFGGNARTHYGFVQRRILDLIQRTIALPGMVLWTAHERRVEDKEDYREVLFGPDVCGKALTARIGASFGNTLHLQKVHVTRKEKDKTTGKDIEKLVFERRLYTREHMDPEAKTYVKFFANTRLPDRVAKAQPDFVQEFFAPPDPVAYYRRLQEAQELNKKLADEEHVGEKVVLI